MHVEVWDDASNDDVIQIKYLANYLILMANKEKKELCVEKLQRILTDVHAFALAHFRKKVIAESPSCIGDYPFYESIHDLIACHEHSRSRLSKWYTPGLTPLPELPETLPHELKRVSQYLTPAKSNKSLLELLSRIYRFYMDGDNALTYPLTTGKESAYAMARSLGLFHISDDLLRVAAEQRLKEASQP